MKISKFFPPYYEKNDVDHCTLKTTFQTESGVYFLKNKEGEITYIGSSKTNLYKTIYRHFQDWSSSTQKRVTYGKYSHTLRIILTTPTQSLRVETYLLNKHVPKDNTIITKLGIKEKANYKDLKFKSFTPIAKDEIIDENAPY